jgi:membrane associated rhomboid family serine protease
MWNFLRREFLYFLVGFVATFVIYLFVRFDADKVLLGVAIGAIGGIVVAVALFALERRFPDQSPPSPQ